MASAEAAKVLANDIGCDRSASFGTKLSAVHAPTIPRQLSSGGVRGITHTMSMFSTLIVIVALVKILPRQVRASSARSGESRGA